MKYLTLSDTLPNGTYKLHQRQWWDWPLRCLVQLRFRLGRSQLTVVTTGVGSNSKTIEIAR